MHTPLEICSDEIMQVWAIQTDISEHSSRAQAFEAEAQARTQLLNRVLPSELDMSHDRYGRPFLIEKLTSARSTLYKGISLTHCRGLVAVALSRTCINIGIDAECTFRIPQLKSVAAKFLTSEQEAKWKNHLVDAWAIKEAAYKAILLPGISLQQIPLPEYFPENNFFSLAAYSARKLSLPGFSGAIWVTYIKTK